MPDDVAEEKVKALLALGAQVERVRPASIVDKKQVCILQVLCVHGLRLMFPAIVRGTLYFFHSADT